MPTLAFKGKQHIYAYHLLVPTAQAEQTIGIHGNPQRR